MSSGLVADIDIESEKYRWMGSARVDIYVSSLEMKGVSLITNKIQYFPCVSIVK